uniref:Uncharacterized protein n=1 Tax=Globodera rostochiensis TaxID=31243 RepID=A0A914I4J9_GLORO
MNAPFYFLISLILPCLCSGLLQCKSGMYNNAGLAYIQILNCTEKESYCSAVSCVGADLVTMLWGCDEHNNCTEIADRVSDENTTCRCKMGEKGVNLSNVKLSFPPEAQTVTTEGITYLFLTAGVRFSAA